MSNESGTIEVGLEGLEISEGVPRCGTKALGTSCAWDPLANHSQLPRRIHRNENE